MIYRLVSSLINGANIQDVLPGIAFTIIVVLFSLSFHEMSHAIVAYKMGDPTARNLGRITLDPSKHLDLIGTICMLLFGFGWARPVPVNSRYFKKPKLGMAMTAIAGPVSNILISFVFALVFSIIISFSDVSFAFYYYGFDSEVLSAETITLGSKIIALLGQLCYYFHALNLYLAIFNFIPIPPLDGSRILFIFLPDKIYFGLMKYERIIMLVMLALLWTGILATPLSLLCNLISKGMFALISLIPGIL